ncbi:MAG: ABC-2 transporter permease [Pseudomonadota bacterium]
MNNILWLIRREIWENRSLWIAPLVLGGVLLITAAFGGMHIGGNNGFSFGFNADSTSEAEVRHAIAGGPLDKRQFIYAATLSGFTVVQLLIMSIVLFFYLLDTLLAERKDRSILFWKSLPVSDTEVVASKLATAIVVVPLFVLTVSAVLHVLFGMVWWVRFHNSPLGGLLMSWDTVTWLNVQASFLLFIAVGILWYLPLMTYLMLVSVWARRNAFLWAVLPPLSILLIEAIISQSHYFADFLGRRLVGLFQLFDLESQLGKGHERLPALGDTLALISNPLSSQETWFGVLAAAAMFVVIVRIRRMRDDS